MSLTNLRTKEYDLRLKVNRLQKLIYQQADPSTSPLWEEMAEAEAALAAVETELAQTAGDEGVIINTEKETALLGPETTGLDVKIFLRMSHVPTAFCHVLEAERDPLLSCVVRNAGRQTRRVRITSFVEGYSARAVATVELEEQDEYEFQQLPTFFPAAVEQVKELTRATLNVLVEDLDGQVELHKTHPIWLLARTTVVLQVKDPKTGTRRDMSPYLGAFVTPNAPGVMRFLRHVVEHHPEKRLIGYQQADTAVLPQVKAVFDALKEKADIKYVNSVINFNPEEGATSQRLRLPEESLQNRKANCLDGTVLFASLLEAISLNPALVIVPGHAFLAWESWPQSNSWYYLETTMIGSHTFEEACASAEATKDKTTIVRFWPLRRLRAERNITPMA